MPWRVGSKVALNVYDDDRPVCQCHSEDDARLIVEAVNHYINAEAQELLDAEELAEELLLWAEARALLDAEAAR